ncbi:low temperature requirement protein A [Micromonospora sp. NPDC049282]|uniref:low temperature requirement protein A n=1 Tax=Micromonospora sp. NPDC049282 TaxID=3364269 RepID=UPI003716BECD
MEGAGAAIGSGVKLLRGERSKQEASFVELFFDLVLVFALNRLVASTAQLASASGAVRWASLLQALLLILPLIWVWSMTAYSTARFEPRRLAVQVMVLVTAFGVLLLGVATPRAFDGSAWMFASVYVALQAGRALVVALALRSHWLQRLYWGILVWFCVSAVAWLLGALAHGSARTLLWSLAIAIEYGSARLGWWVPWQGPERILAWESAAGHLADRYQQLLLIALGETILAVGIAYTEASGNPRLPQTLGLVIAFITAVLLWRIYFYKAGELFGSAVRLAANPASLGRVAGTAHLFMIIGVAATAIGNELVQRHPTGHTFKSWLALMLGGPALYVAGRTLLEWVVFSRVSRHRLLGIAALLLLAVPLAFAPPLAVVAAVPVVLIAIAVADARRAAGRPAEAPTPPS